jgi:hypothetical protein
MDEEDYYFRASNVRVWGSDHGGDPYGSFCSQME